MRRTAALFSISIALSFAGCSGDGGAGTVGPDLSVLPDLAPPPDLLPPSYPPGPYGPTVGDTAPNLTLQGYYAATATTGLSSAQPFGDVTLERFHHEPAGRYLLLFVAGYS